MLKECEAASWWFASQLHSSYPPLSSDQVLTFQQTLMQTWVKKYTGHWYVEEPDRGNAYRSILKNDRVIDNVLLTAANAAQISDIRTRLNGDFIMWIDPHTVKVQYSNTHKRVDIYSSAEAISMAS